MTDDPALLAAGYALGTLTPEELAAYRAYLSSSAEARAEADDLAAVTDALAHEAPPVTPPPALKAALMAKIAATPQLPTADAVTDPAGALGEERVRPLERVRPQERVRPPAPGGAESAPVASAPTKGRAGAKARVRWFRAPGAIAAAAAAAVLLFVGGTLFGVGLAGGDAGQQQARALVQLNQAPDTQRASAPVSGGGTATLVYSSTLGKSALLVRNLDRLPAGKTYELWYIDSSGATPAGTMEAVGSGTTWRVLEGRFTPGDTVGVTVEPAGGSKQPTTKPLVAIKS